MRGYVQVYTGDGKGKTTAALGLAIRAVGAGLRVFIAQFVKGMEYSELKVLRKFSDSVVVRQYGRDCFIYREPEEKDRELAREGLQEV
jgi:cob(I)alamin adenosyltransferase